MRFPSQLSRRQFLIANTAGLGCLALHAATPTAGLAHDVGEEALRRKKAKHIMTFASPYDSAEGDLNPHMHQELKRNVQELSNGTIYVDIIDKGKAGVGTDLSSDVSRGVRSAALVSVSNLVPAAPQLDVLNIPFWIEGEQGYLNLITSQVFDDLIFKRIRSKQRLDKLFYYLPGFRSITTTRGYEKTIRDPGDLDGVVFRVPPSKTLQEFYRQAGAVTKKVPWKNVAKAAERKAIEAMDPGVIGLYGGPNGVRHQLGSIMLIDSVYDGWVAVISQMWFDSLDSKSKDTIKEAADKTFRDQLIKVSAIENHCINEFSKLGVEVYQPTKDERAEWIDYFGPQQSYWTPFKESILGKIEIFDQLVDATKVENGYWI